jgi:hypothetical protein
MRRPWLTATVTATAADKACGVGVRPRVHRWTRADGRRHDADASRLMGRRWPWAGVEGRGLGASHVRAGRLRASAGHGGRRRSGAEVRDAFAWTGGGRLPLPEIGSTASARFPVRGSWRRAVRGRVVLGRGGLGAWDEASPGGHGGSAGARLFEGVRR